MTDYPTPPANLALYVEVLGPDLAVEFLLKFGGADLYLPSNPKGKSEVEKLLGAEKVAALSIQAYALTVRVPIGKPWICAMLHQRGLSKAEIARTVHATTNTVSRHIAKFHAVSAADSNQLTLF